MDKFKNILSNINEAISKTGSASYHSIVVNGKFVHYTRGNTGVSEKISIDELYNVYKNENFINTNILRSYITGRKFSPAFAILVSAGFYDNNGNRNNNISNNIINTPTGRIKKRIPKTKKNIINKEKDETRFYLALDKVLGNEYLQSKSIGKPISTEDIALYGDYNLLELPDNINVLMTKILDALLSNEPVNTNNLASNIDGLIQNHPQLGSCIVEFDEEQHFTPARLDTLKILSSELNIIYANDFIEICVNPQYLHNKVLKKHRVTFKHKNIFPNFINFQNELEKSNITSSGYIEAKKGFMFLGGRIAQRAYYDSLREVAHLSKKNKHLKLKPCIRFSKKSFEDEYQKDFKVLTEEQIQSFIKQELSNKYKINI